jgi:hypothetical protein
MEPAAVQKPQELGNGNIFVGKFIRLAALLDNQPNSTKAELNVGTEMLGQHLEIPSGINVADPPGSYGAGDSAVPLTFQIQCSSSGA